MEKRLWIKIEGIKLHSFKKFLWQNLMGPNAGTTTERNDASFRLRLGNFLDVSGFEIALNAQKGIVSHNDAMTEVRFLDESYVYHEHIMTRPLLGQVLSKEIYIYCNQTNREEVVAFLEGRQKSLKDSGLFQPKDWKHPLRIPVDFIKLHGFNARGGGIVLSNIMIGHHVLLSNVRVYPSLDSKGTILDERIIEMINNILESKKVKKMLDYTKKVDLWFTDAKFIDSIPGCDFGKMPPITFY